MEGKSKLFEDVTNVLFIKLGRKGGYEEDSIENNVIRLSYDTVDHELCVSKAWDKVKEYFMDVEKKSKKVASFHTNQIKHFYEAGENTLWITFYKNKLWWCFSKPEIKLLKDKTKTRQVIGKWSDENIEGKILSTENISGKLLKTQGFRGTICTVPEKKYVLSIIKNEKSKDVIDIEQTIKKLNKQLIKLIENLQWQDFEILVDLIFRQAGWQRLGATGKTQKTIDLELMMPVTGERALVQIKSQSSKQEFEKYQKEFEEMNFDKFFYVVNKKNESLDKHAKSINTNVKLIFADKLAELSINSGLMNWIIKKTI